MPHDSDFPMDFALKLRQQVAEGSLLSASGIEKLPRLKEVLETISLRHGAANALRGLSMWALMTEQMQALYLVKGTGMLGERTTDKLATNLLKYLIQATDFPLECYTLLAEVGQRDMKDFIKRTVESWKNGDN